MTLAPGSTFGPYKIIEPVGRGGMASVFRAYEPGLDRYVALKVLPAQSVQDEASAERFKREAKVIARLEHPNITPIHNFGIDEATQVPWMAMRLISGGTLSSRLTMRLTPQRAVTILRGVGDALDYAHAKGVMHRDVKPANILLDEAGRVYLADFGIARLVEGATALTAAGLISGTPVYMAPEQATGLTLDHRVDIYALGVVAYEVLAGKVPFAADNPIDVLMKHVQSPVPVVPDLPAPVMDALLKALAKKPQDRWQTAGALVSELEATIAQMPVVGAAPTTPGMTALPLAGEFWTAEGTHPPAPPTVPSAHPSPSVDTATPTRQYAPPSPPLPPRDSTIGVPTRPGALRAGGVERASRTGLIAVIVAAVGVLGLAAAAGLYMYLRPDPAPLAETAPAAAEETARVAADSPAEAAPPAATVPPRAAAIERETPAAPPVTVAPRAQPVVPAALPSVAPAARPTAAAAVPVTPATTLPAALGTLHLDVSAVQPSFGAMSSAVAIEVRVDGEPMRTVSIRFDGTTPFARSRRRQTFDIPGIRVGQRNVSVVVRADGVEELQTATQLDVSEDGETAILDVRLRGNGEGDVRFR